MGIYAVEFSVEQNCFHIDNFEETLKKNIKMSLNKISNDYKILFVGNYNQCRNFINNCNIG